MNLIILDKSELENQFFPSADRRYRHIRRILKSQAGDRLRGGVLSGPRGIITITSIEPDAIHYTFEADTEPLAPLPVYLLCGLPRPQQVKRILRDGTAMGVSAIWFPHSVLGEKSYFHSPIWADDHWMGLVIDGLEQSGNTIPPDIRIFDGLQTSLAALPPNITILTLDIPASTPPLLSLLDTVPAMTPTALVIGSERGWTDSERSFLRQAGSRFGHLGPRILRSDTACIAAVSLASARLYS
ncbi:16S rRNA (uracil(1498)-N(3))-methyltransferase [bacterium]|nr:16S rRNA (uracil(1498)-N(3))-methyltransferase [candidate division CSSED10-310 bacterium]